MLKAHDSSETKSFVTHEEFEDYIEQISNNSVSYTHLTLPTNREV